MLAAFSLLSTSNWGVAVSLLPAANVVTTHQSRLTSEAETSFHLKAPSTVSSPTESPTGTKPTDMTPALKTGTFVTSPASGTRTSAHLRPPNTSVTVSKTTGVTESVPTQPSDTNITCTLIAVIAVLCVLLFVVCFLAALHRRKQSSKAVMPACVKEEKRREPEEDDRSSHEQCPGRSELDLKRAFRGVRAKSANAVILTSPFGVSKKDEVTFQTETEIQLEVSEKPGEGKQKPVAESEVAAAGGGIQMDGDTTTDTMKECERQDDDDDDDDDDAGGNLDQNPECIYVNTDLVPYLSIGTSQNKDEESTKGPNQRSQMGKVMGRVSTWPPTAAQWQARCKVKEEEEGLAVWTKNETVKLSDEVEKVLSKMRHPSGSDLHNEEEETSAPLNLRHCLPSQPNEDTHVLGSTSEEQLKKDGILDAAAKTRNQIGQTQELTSAEDPAHKSRSKTEARKGQKQSATGRQKAGNRTAGSKAPSGGTSPDDETLLSGNEYAFMDLLQEVAQNNGRWTRDRWKQVHANKQRR
ncbi:uncharacterized protein [Leuresthes tenuis]|uniref:uncharacterized protein n=1 Tax=Leuresthes tenuis TaxID=355514 RepID=UPI003B511F01